MASNNAFKSINRRLENDWGTSSRKKTSKKAHKKQTKKSTKKAKTSISAPAKVIAVDNAKNKVAFSVKNFDGTTKTSIKSIASVRKDIKNGKTYFLKKPNNKLIATKKSIKIKGSDEISNVSSSVKNRYSYPRHHYISKFFYSFVMIGIGAIGCIGLLSYFLTK